MTVIRNVVTAPGGGFAAGEQVAIRLVAATTGNAGGFTSGGEVVGRVYLTTGSDGSWSVDLTPQASITPSGSVYEVVEKQGSIRVTSYITVPASGGPYLVGAVLAEFPGSLPSQPVLTETAARIAADAAEATARAAGDAANAAAVTAEAAARVAADALKATADQGTPSTPNTPALQPRGGTAAQWTAANPVLAAREQGIETDTGYQKVGDGVTAWTALPYMRAATAGDLPARGPGSKAYTKGIGATPVQLRWVSLGDSVAELKMRWMFKALNRAYGGGVPGAAISTGSTGTGWGITGTTVNSSSGVTGATADFDAWFSGVTSRFATNGNATYGIGGVSAFWDTAKVYYVKGPSSPDGGTFKIQVDGVDEAGFTNVSASNASITLGIATITRGSVAQHSLGIINLTGAHRIIGVAFFSSTQGGLIHCGIDQGGIRMDDAVSTAGGRGNLQAFLADFAPDVVTLECKEASSYFAAALSTMLPIITAGAPTATFVGIGSTPVSSGDADQVIQNAQLRAACFANGGIYWDGYAPVVNYATLNALGWAGDGTHPTDQCNEFLAGLMLRDLGLLDHPGLNVGNDLDFNNARLRTILNIGDVRSDGAALSNASVAPSGSGFDVTATIRRVWQWISASGTADTNSWVMRPDNSSDQQIPNGVKVGLTGPYLQANGTALSVYSARGGGSARDFEARCVSPATQTQTLSGNGTLTLDFAVGSAHIIDLQANATSIVVANQNGNKGMVVTVRLRQDGTGGRTYVFAAGTFKLNPAGAAPAGTASTQDLYTFVFDSSTGRYYELSRTLGVAL